MNAIEILEVIQAITPQDKILLLSMLSYDTTPVTGDLVDNDIPAWKNVNELVGNVAPIPFVYNLPAGSQTPIILNFNNSTIKIGAASPVNIGTDLTKYKSNIDVVFSIIIDSINTKPTGNIGWITNEKWADNSYISLVEITLQPDTDTGLPGGITLDNINIIIKP